MVAGVPPAARILVVDDEEANVDLLEQMLARAGFTNIASTTDPRRALPLYHEFRPDLILLDLLMPYLDGFAVMRQLREASPEGTYLPIVILTADATPEAKRRALDSGATDFLTKPFDHIELLLRVRNLLQTRYLHLGLEAQVRRLEGLYEEACESLELRSQQFAAITHDLGQPLTSMRLATQNIQRRQVAELEAVAALEDMINRMLGMVGEMLDLSRLEAGRPLDLDYRPVDLIALVREEVAAQQRMTTRHRLVLEAAVEELVGELDGPRISRVIANLLSNAVKYSPDGGTITVTVTPEREGWVAIGVHDEGLGIPAADLPHVFERFERGSNVAGRIAGSGLGLAGARQIVEQHGGTISVESTEGSGAIFTARLPLT